MKAIPFFCSGLHCAFCGGPIEALPSTPVGLFQSPFIHSVNSLGVDFFRSPLIFLQPHPASADYLPNRWFLITVVPASVFSAGICGCFSLKLPTAWLLFLLRTASQLDLAGIGSISGSAFLAFFLQLLAFGFLPSESSFFSYRSTGASAYGLSLSQEPIADISIRPT